MAHKVYRTTIVASIVLWLLCACALPSPAPNPYKAGPCDGATMVAAGYATPFPTSGHGTLDTELGQLTVSSFALVATFPEGCPFGLSDCLRPRSPDNQLLAVRLTKIHCNESVAILDDDSLRLFNLCLKAVRLVAMGSAPTRCLQSGWDVYNGNYIVFEVPLTAREFSLEWPGNPPLSLKE